jgi:uncharacterized protein (TIGR00290 family)
MKKVFASWSGGKDCSLALYRARSSGLDVCYLANTVTADGKRSCSHGISASVIKKQAEAMGIPIMQQPTTGDNYREKFVAMLNVFKRQGVEGGVFGDIDFNPHREWIESVCAEAGMTPYLPLWLEDQVKLMHEFIDAGFTAVVVAVRADLLGPEALGMTIDREFLAYIEALDKGITPCGEAGEFHTLVIDGPVFKKRLEILKSEKVSSRGDHHFLEIMETGFKSKHPVGRA